MIQFSFAQINKRKEADAIVLPVMQKDGKTIFAFSSKIVAQHSTIHTALADHTGKEGEILTVYWSEQKEKRCILLGLGSQQKITAEVLRCAYAAAVKLCVQRHWTTLNIAAPEQTIFQPQQSIEAICEGMLLANYLFDLYKTVPQTKPCNSIARATLLDIDPSYSTHVARVEAIATGVYLARDLVNGNACDVTPQYLAHTAEDLAKQFPKLVKTTVHNKAWIQKQKMGLFLGVNEGAKQDPAFIIVEYNGNTQSKEKTAIVGKGVTFDSGGLNLKPTGLMETMKCDMAGAAAVLGTIQTLSLLKLKVNVIALIAATENGIDANSYKPGDVYRSHSGKTVEIINTDAEGRLTLADAMSYACKQFKPKQIIDLATLTGAVVIALGAEASGLMSNNDMLAQSLTQAGDECHERLWRLPLFDEYKELLRSDIADLKNAGGRAGGVILAALFLQQFIGETPWAHLDIAGTACLTKSKTYHPTLATGVGVRLLTSFFEKQE